MASEDGGVHATMVARNLARGKRPSGVNALRVCVVALVGLLAAALPASAATIYGTARADSLRGTVRADKIYGRGGADTIRGLRGPDRLLGAGGTDRLIAGAGADHLYGGGGNDRFEARGGGRDLIHCGAGNDTALVDVSDVADPDCEVVRLPPACSDGIDNDGDGASDYYGDPGCSSSTDASEQEALIACDDGLDNDGDGLIDYPRDPDCTNGYDLLEGASPAPVVGGTCSASYPTVCIPPPPPDLNCADIPYTNFTVLAPDPHGFDANSNGVGCEA